ncbi:MAG: hypothetical protein ACI4CT_00585 [Lachnospiraceae bacterium]
MKKQYSEPKLLIVPFIHEDMITFSTNGNINSLDTDSSGDFDALAYNDLYIDAESIFNET